MRISRRIAVIAERTFPPPVEDTVIPMRTQLTQGEGTDRGALRNPDQLRAPPRLAIRRGSQDTAVRLSFS